MIPKEKKDCAAAVEPAFRPLHTDLKNSPINLQFSPAKPLFNGVGGWPDLFLD
jgi:hypothetical protein